MIAIEGRPTATDLLVADVDALRIGFEELLAQSTITYHNPSRDGIFFMGPTCTWSELDVDGQRLQSRLLEEYARYHETLRVLLRSQPDDALKELTDADEAIRDFLQRNRTWHRTVEQARAAVVEALETQVGLLQRLHDAGDGVDVFLPDTNALLHNPALEEWTFEGSERFELVLGPAIVAELDELKINHRNEVVRDKAEGLITRIKGYRSRGRITAGVPLRKPASTIRAIASEPRMDESLSWLDPANRDDQFIATTIEVARQHPRSAVTIVTRDINLQNKAELARLPFVEPPDPTEQPERKRGPRHKVRVYEIGTFGGQGARVDFGVEVQNREQTQLRLDMRADVDGENVTVNPSQIDVVANDLPKRIWIYVPRPELGNLVKAFNDDTTLYGRTLTFEVSVDGETVGTATWREHEYTAEENSARYEIQQREWRIGRGEATEADNRADMQAEVLRRHDEASTRAWISQKSQQPPGIGEKEF